MSRSRAPKVGSITVTTTGSTELVVPVFATKMEFINDTTGAVIHISFDQITAARTSGEGQFALEEDERVEFLTSGNIGRVSFIASGTNATLRYAFT